MSYQAFIAQLDTLQAECIAYLDQRFRAVDGVTRKMRYKVPFYDYGKWICYLNPVGKTQIELCFLDGILMAEAFPALDIRGRKKVSGLMIDVESDIEEKTIVDMLQYAISLNNDTV